MQELIFETMESYNNYINAVTKGSLEIADKLRAENLEEALPMIKDFSEGLLWLIDVNQKLFNLGYSAQLEMDDVQEYLIEINDGLQNKDYVLVADMFEYEILPYFEQLEQYTF
ncbi:hypothetical protein [Solibacillus daqui]|uniref:hypothetical protein n=1 Tax=Solibacillus daqui TaxID=2912187 RepID=UPI002365FEEE|nr:hypothetical protein [Solibacillus daqui]